ncbi:MAG: ComEC/Rec2 family competence protein, partial [Thermoleophilia bacterium]|nr:ComEC/Rec2 family competence protein [Thermoleophilia bacterium]
MDRFVRRAGVARFTTFACALGAALPAVTGPRAVPAVVGLMTSVAGALGGVACRRLRRTSWALLVAILLTGFWTGYLTGTVRVAALTGGDLQQFIGRSVEAELVITGQVRANAGWQSATAVVRATRLQGDACAADLVGRCDPGVGESVLLEVAPADQPDGDVLVLEQGMIVDFQGTIEEPEGPTDSGYDQARRLLHQGIQVVFAADGGSALTVVGRRGGVAGWFDRLRASAMRHLMLGPDDRYGEALQGVVLGETVGLDKGWMEAFRRSGTAHMLSVSGLHVGSLAAIMLGVARLLGAARWVGFVLAALSAVFMIPFVGPAPPIVRAAIMIVVVLMGRWVGRGRDQWQVLGLAAVLILALNPFALFDVGFQLSFSAFAGMLSLTAPVQRLLRRLPPGMSSNVAVSIAASVGTAPVSLAVFGRTSLVAPLANLLVVPFLPAITGLGMASVFLGFAWSGLSMAFATLASLPMSWTVSVSRLMGLAPVLEAADLGRVLTALVAAALALPAALALMGYAVRAPFGMSLPWFRRSMKCLRRHKPRSRRWAAAAGLAVVVTGLLAGYAGYPAAVRGVEALQVLGGGRSWPSLVEVRVLDIGQGNAVLVRTPDHHSLLFDGGPEGCGLAEQLRSLGVRHLDVVLVSHPHADHFAGLLEGWDGLEVDTFIDQVQVVSENGAAAGLSAAGSVAGIVAGSAANSGAAAGSDGR